MTDPISGKSRPMAEPFASPALEPLLDRFVDETLSAEDERRLAALLSGDAAARRAYRRWMELHAALQWEYARAALPLAEEAGAEPSAAGDRLPPPAGRAASWHRIVIASLLVAVCAAVGALLPAPWGGAMLQRGGRPTVEVVALSGSASWSGGGEVLSGLAVGDALKDGVVSLEGAAAFIQLRYKDGTLVTVVGNAMLEFGERRQKRLVLRHGALSIDARPQPPGRPMVIRTPTAEVEVVGTVFSISADEQATQLGVEEGSVRMRRLADGKVVEVPQRRVAIASLDAAAPLSVGSPALMPSSFRQHFEVPPVLKWEGQWLPAADGQPGRLRAAPRIAGRRPDATPIVHHGISLHAPDSGFVAFGPHSVVTIRCRMVMRETLRFMLSMRRPEGGFAGNFEAKVRFDEASGEVDADGWRTVTIPADRFLPIVALHPQLTPGVIVSLLLVETFKSEAELEVAALSVSAPDAPEADVP
ncbi:MAG: hypothetical protein RLZZ111_1563 [Planctomycetota bacterium]|jgi:ferric-dicitrate binding protein FerR (iron transport regulator)